MNLGKHKPMVWFKVCGRKKMGDAPVMILDRQDNIVRGSNAFAVGAKRYKTFITGAKRSKAFVAGVAVLGLAAVSGLTALAANIIDSLNSADSVHYERIADPNTMEDYLQTDALGVQENSRNAGRIWTDKTVFAKGYQFNDTSRDYQNGDPNKRFSTDGTLSLNDKDDGSTSQVKTNTDFLQVFSALGSSQVIDQYTAQSLDVVLLLDVSSSMTKRSGSNMDTNDSLHQVLNRANKLINQLMGNDSEHPVAQEVLPLGHYTSSSSDGIYMKITDKTNKASGNGYFPIISSNVNGKSITTKPMLADATYLQGGLYKGLKMLADEQNTTYKNPVTGMTDARTPILISLTDGATNMISTTKSSRSNNDTYDWWQPFDGIIPTAGSTFQYPNSAVNPFYADCNDNTGYGDDSSTRNKIENRLKETEAISARNVSNLLMAGYYKNKIESNYQTSMKGYTISFNTNGIGEYSIEQLLGTMNPEEYFREDREINFDYLNNTSKVPAAQKEAKKAEIKQYAKKQVDKTKELLMQYISNQNPTYRFPESGTYYYLNSGYADFTWKHPADVANDVKSLEDVYYVDEFYTASDSNIENVFDDIFDKISTQGFVPIEGDNDSGVSNSLLYNDPIGEYMEVKDDGVTIDGQTYDMALLLFEKMHGLEKTGVYDYKFSSTHRGPEHNSSTEGTFQEGWYDSEGNLLGYYNKDEDGNIIGDIIGTVGSFENGDTYYFGINTIRQYVSTLSEDENMLTSQEKNTVYTAYRFADGQGDRLQEQQNPCYEKGTDAKYSLSDFRVWVEDTGAFIDEQSGAAIDLGYEEAIYVNIPNNALPIMTADISIGTNGEVTYRNDTDYLSNMENPVSDHVTPLRLFYGVGLKDEILTNDGRDIDVAKLDQEYMNYHKHKETGDLYFLSNYFSDTSYDSYVSGETDTRRRGDASSTFSPADINRYYIFQKPLILYKLDEGDELNTDDSGQVTYTEKILDDNAYNDFVSKHQDEMIKDGNIDSSAWYWMVGDYYTDKGLVHLAVTRKGSEYGGAIGGGDSEIENGEYLVWYNPQGEGLMKDNIRDYSRTSNIPPDDSGNWVIATKPGGLRVGDLSQMVNNKERNVTNTADTVAVPTVSPNSTKDSIIIDKYHGNNGKIIIPNKLLQVTKEVETDDPAFNPEMGFDFEVRIANYTGAHDAIVLIKNPYSKEWQLRMDTISIVTDNHGLLQTAEHSGTTVAKVNRGGREYYIYVGAGADDPLSEGTYLLFDQAHQNELSGVGRNIYVSPEDYETLHLNSKNNMRYQPADNKNKVGSVDYWVDKVYLIPTDIDLETWEFDETAGDALYQTESQFVISHLDSTLNGIDQLSSNYLTKSSYLTQKVWFGYDEDGVPEEKPEDFTGSDEDWAWLTDPKNANVARFVLKDQEGLEFVGLNHGNDYDVSIVEVLEDSEVEEGYTFERVEDDEAGLQKHEVDTNREDGSTGYKVSGSIVDRVEEHYVNKYRPNFDLTVDNTVLGSLADKGKEWTYRVKLTPEEYENFKSEYYYQKCTPKDYVREGEDKLDCHDMDGKLVFKPNPESGYYEAELKLKDGDIYRVKNIPAKTEYEVTEDEANQDGYDSVYRTKNEYDNYTDLMTEDRNVGIINSKFAPADLAITKNVRGSLGDTEKVWNFTLALFPDEGYVLNDAYKAEGASGGDLQFTKNQDGSYTANFQLKHGQTLTVKDLPEGLHYKVTEAEAGTDGYITTVENDNAEGAIQTDNITTNVKFNNGKYDSRKLSIGKRVEGSLADTNEEFTFNITLTPSRLVRLDDSYPYTGSHIAEGAQQPADGELKLTEHYDDGLYYTGTVKLKHGQQIDIEGLPEGTQYLIEEEDVSHEGYTTRVPSNNSGMLTTLGETVVFVNSNPTTVEMNVEKQVINGNYEDENRDWNFEIYLTPPLGIELSEQYNYTGSKSGKLTFVDNGDGSFKSSFTLKHGQSIMIDGIPEGTRYEVRELDANQNGFISGGSNNASGVLINGNPPTVQLRNIKLEPQTLNIGKTVLGEAGDTRKTWTFNINLGSTGQIINEVHYDYTGGTTYDGVENPGDGFISFRRNIDGTYSGQITLEHGQYITIHGLEEGTTYDVQEVENSQNGCFTFSDDTNGSISSTIGSLVLYNNLLPGQKDLTLAKIVHGASGFREVAAGKTFTYKVSLTPIEHVSLASVYSYDGTKSGVINLTYDAPSNTYNGYISGLTHNDSITIHGLPERTKYVISEEGADDYIQRIDGRNPGRLYDANTDVTINNTKSSDVGLSIKKNVGGNLGDKDRYFKFTVVLTPPANFTLNHEYPYVKDNGESGFLTLTENALGNLEGIIEIKDGEMATISGLPEGTKYMVDEEDLTSEGYITTSTGNTRGVINKNGLLVEFDNWKSSKHKLLIEKQLKGDDVEEEREWNFEITLNVDPNIPDIQDVYPYIKSTVEAGSDVDAENDETIGSSEETGGSQDTTDDGEAENDVETGALQFTKVEGTDTYVAEFKLKGGERISLEGLPYNSEYSVVEKDKNVDGYTSTAENTQGILTEDEHSVVFINERNKPSIIEEILGIPNTGDGILRYTFLACVGFGGIAFAIRKIYRAR